MLGHLADIGMGEEEQRNDQEVREHEHEHRALPEAKTAARRHRHQADGGDRDGHVLGDTEVAEREADADELGDDRQEVEQEQVAD